MDRTGANTQLRIAAIDIGTNTCLMLIAEQDAVGEFTVIRDEHAIVRLGENLDKTRKISDEAYTRLSSTLIKYKSIINELQITDIAACGTSAFRDALNRDEILVRVKNDFDINISIIEGNREAELTYLGATFDLPPIEGLTAVIDIGGGSTEIAFGNNTEFTFGRSSDVGAVRLTEQGLNDTNSIQSLLQTTFSDIETPARVIAVAGTPTTLAAMRLGLLEFDRERVNHCKLTLEEVKGYLDILTSQTQQTILEIYPVIPSGRVDILPSGTAILFEVMKFLKVENVSVSTGGLRYGIALDALATLSG